MARGRNRITPRANRPTVSREPSNEPSAATMKFSARSLGVQSSSGAIEEDWTPKDLAENFMVAALGSLLGSLLTVGLLALGVILFLPRAIFPQTLSTAVFSGAFPFAQKALIAAIAGCLACLAGATVETALSGGYNVCQF